MGLWGFGKKALNSTIGTSNAAPLDAIIKNEMYKVQSICIPSFGMKSIVNEASTLGLGGSSSSSTVCGSFKYDGDLDEAYVSLALSICGSSSSVTGVFVATSLYSASTTFANLSAGYAAYISSYGSSVANKNFGFKAQQGVTYYFHITAQSSSGYVNNCVLRCYEHEIKKQIIDTEHSKYGTTPLLIGSFDFKDQPDGLPIEALLVANLKNNES